MVFCVPTHNRSFVDLTCYPEKDTTLGGIRKAVKLLWYGPLKDILGYPVTNSHAHSSTFDAGAAVTLNDHFVSHISYNGMNLGIAIGCWASQPHLSRNKKSRTMSFSQKKKREVLGCWQVPA